MKKKTLLGFALLLLPAVAFSHNYQQQDDSQSKQIVLRPAKKRDATVAAGPLPSNDIDVILDAEFLYWNSSISNMPYAVKNVLLDTNSVVNPNLAELTPKTVYQVDTSWDPGARVGLGVVTSHDGWDLYADWTYFYTSETDSKSVAPFVIGQFGNNTVNPIGTEALYNPWATTVSGTFSVFNHIASKWSLLFNQLDLTLGRKYWISQNLTLHPFVGVRGHWSRLHFRLRSRYNNNPDPTGTQTIDRNDRLKQKVWSVGLLGGLNTAWHMTKSFSIFAQGDVALTYGQFNGRHQFSYHRTDDTGAVTFDFNPTIDFEEIYALITTLDLALGLRYETTFSNDSYRFQLDLGWENHIWINYNKLMANATNDTTLYRPNQQVGDLTMSGIVTRVRFDF